MRESNHESVKHIAVLMTCFNRVQTTLACLRSLFAQKVPDGYSFEVWLVDDASPDQTGKRVKEAFPQVNVIQSPGNLFWCKGMRLAWDKAAEHCDYDFYLWLNDDVVLSKDALMNTFLDYDRCCSNESHVMVGAFFDGKNSTNIFYSAGGVNGRIVPNGKDVIEAREWMCGNFVLVPRAVYKGIGPISNFYHHCYGDYDYSRRLMEHNIPFYVISRPLGYCLLENKPFVPLKTLRFKARLQLLWIPSSFNLADAVYYKYRHFGFLRAVLSLFHVAFIVIFAIGNKR